MPKSISVCATPHSASPAPRRICRSIQPGEASCSSSSSAAQTARMQVMRPLNSVIPFAILVAFTTASTAGSESELRGCADPNNLPLSNSAGAGFENKLAEMVAAHLDQKVAYTWWAQRRGFIRNTLKAGQSDVVKGEP